MPKRTGLGKGLDALIPAGESKPSSGGGGVTLIAVDLIQRNPRQPREKFDIEELENLAASIREHGVIQPLIVTPGKNGVYELPLDPHVNRTGDVWHVRVDGLPALVEFGYRVDRQPNDKLQVHRYDPSAVVIDPYARALTANVFPPGSPEFDETALRSRRTWRAAIADEEFDWGLDQPLNRHLADSIIYELHVRGFTIHPSARVAHLGTFRAMIEKIPYLKELGVTAVELMPVTEFDDRLRRLVTDMAETMYDAPGVGLAATHVDVHERVIVIDTSETKDELLVLINPEIVWASEDLVECGEGCLSVPGVYDAVTRPAQVRVRAYDAHGKVYERDRCATAARRNDLEHGRS